MTELITPGKVELLQCTISSTPFREPNGRNNFHVQELRIYEDICKAYFTGQLVIETEYNTYETFLNPGAIVQIGFEAPRSDGGPTKSYYEDFRIYSYDTKPRTKNSVVHTISLIGQEFYNDKTNTVQQPFSNIPGIQAAVQIHQQYMQAGHGSVRPLVQSTGLIATEQVPHMVNNKKPIKAIHDILDSIVFAQYKSCAAVYYRDKYGHVMAPLQHLMESASVSETFQQKFTRTYQDAFTAYNQIQHLRPMSPPGEQYAGQTISSIDGIFKSAAAFDVQTGTYLTKNLADFDIGSLVNASADVIKFIKSLEGSIKSLKFGGQQLMSIIDQRKRPAQTDKQGPGGFNTSEDAFLASLTYIPKYWVSVPLQTGVNVTCGQRIFVIYPTGTDSTTVLAKTLFVPRLIHELKFTEGQNRKTIAVQGVTEIYGVDWNK